MTRRKLLWSAAVGFCGLMLVGVMVVWLSPTSNKSACIHTHAYSTLTCGDWLRLSSADQAAWSSFDLDVSKARAVTDTARANLASWSIEEWTGSITDACRSASPGLLAFPW